MIDRVYLVYAGQFLVSNFLETFKEYPPRMKAASFTVDQIMEKIESGMGGSN
jgi:arylsulfatase